eukprot:CAMPEP_0183338038 /NCGR_PEP_ID=MMETSP0164_2-20130417/5470_1 /TAXON_ID=221442 /ORGANISM="Coccolithus pelagicus ssp braarudi, Strain PLY182g" /LENGTH=636 /DNA_ID=CAMNT_0025507819 /DNA_START=39 /DNA_END=1949 /DNA_ORIENTATION=+
MASMELEHAIGFNGTSDSPLHLQDVDETGGEGIVYASGGCVVLGDLRDAHKQSFLRGHDGLITCLTLSPSGRLAVSGQHGDNSDAIVWDVANNQALYRLQEHDHGVAIVGFDVDERFLLTVGVRLDAKLVVWDMDTGMIVVTCFLQKPVTCATWGGRKKDIKGRDTVNMQVATGGEGILTLWTLDTAAGTMTGEECVTTVTRNYSKLVFSCGDRDYLFAGSSSGDFTSFHVKHKVMHSVTAACSNAVTSLVSLPADRATADDDDRFRLLVGGGDGLIALFQGDGRNFRILASVQVSGAVCSLHPKGDLCISPLPLLAGTASGFMYDVKLDIPQKSAVQILQESHCGAVTAVAFAPGDPSNVVTTGADGTIRLWDLSTYTVLTKGECQVTKTGKPTCVCFSGEVIFTGWEDGKLRAHDAEDGQLLWTIDDAHRGGVTALVCANNVKFLVTGGEKGEVRAWEIRTRDMIRHLKQHSMPVTSLQMTPDDSKVLSASRDRSILMWDLKAGVRLVSLQQPMGGINSIALFLDEAGEATQLVSVGQDKRVSFWHTQESTPLEASSKGIGEQHAVARSSDGKFFATAGADHKVRLWKYDTTELLIEGVGHSAGVLHLAFSPDDKQLVSVGEDGNVLVWNVYKM